MLFLQPIEVGLFASALNIIEVGLFARLCLYRQTLSFSGLHRVPLNEVKVQSPNRWVDQVLSQLIIRSYSRSDHETVSRAKGYIVIEEICQFARLNFVVLPVRQTLHLETF